MPQRGIPFAADVGETNQMPHRPALPGDAGLEETKKTGSKSSKPSRFVRPLAASSALMLYLAEAGNDRLTINQAAFFLIAAAADARGAPMTLTEIMDGADGILNPSLQNTYKVLLEPRKGYKKIGLGWLDREVDEDDERRRYLRVTDKGWAVVKAALLALGEQPYGKKESLS